MASRDSKNPNPYVLAVLTALMSGVCALAGVYLASSLSGSQSLNHASHVARTAAYQQFFEAQAASKESLLAQLQYVEGLVDASFTDSEIQQVEDYIAEIVPLISTEKVIELTQSFTTVRGQASQLVLMRITDLFYALNDRSEEIRVSSYPHAFQAWFIELSPDNTRLRPQDVSPELRPLLRWLASFEKTGTAYFDVRVDESERFRVLLAAKIYGEIISQMNKDIHSQRRN